MNMNKIWKWLYAAGIRALKTFAQTAASLITVGATIGDINWGIVISSSAVAAIYSLCTSIGGLPEIKLEEQIEELQAKE